MPKQKMFLAAQYEQLVKNFKEQDGTKEFKAVVKLFNPAGVGTWYLSELNPETNVAFGLADVHEKELGYTSIDELKAFKAPFGLGIERDTSFEMNKQSLEELNQ
jgi:hypothetical protein